MHISIITHRSRVHQIIPHADLIEVKLKYSIFAIVFLESSTDYKPLTLSACRHPPKDFRVLLYASLEPKLDAVIEVIDSRG